MPSEALNPVKKEVIDNKSPASKKVTGSSAKPHSKVTKVKKEEPEANESPRPVKPATSASRSKEPKVKKEDNDNIDDDDKPLAKKSSNLKEPKKKKKVKEEEKKKEEPAAQQKKKERKVYDLPGQKRDPPEQKDPVRIFYETLYKQVPNSEMAQLWMMESGLLLEEVAMKVHEKKQKKGLQQKLTSPVKSVVSEKSSTRSVTVKKNMPSSPVPSVKKKTTDSKLKQSKKRKAEDESSEDDYDNTVLATAKWRKVA